MIPLIEETIYVDFVTSSPTTGAAADADFTPTAEVFEDDNDTAIITPAVARRSGKIGNYRVSIACTAANGFDIGKSYNVIVSATVGTVAAKAVARTFQIRDSLDTEIAGIKAQTDQLVFTDGKVDANATLTIAADDLTAIADAILTRNWSSVSGEAAYSTLTALRMLRCAWDTEGGVLHVYKEDGTTLSWQRTLGVDPTAAPIVSST